MATPPYALAHKARKDAQNQSKIVVEGIDEPKRDPMAGVTDPKKLLKSGTQRIDKNVYDPDDPHYAHKPGAVQPNTTT